MAAQIEFLRLTSGNNFPGNSAPGAITASLTGLTPALLHRRIYAEICQPADYTRRVTFTLTFKLAGVSVGSITQRCLSTGDSAPVGVSQFYSLGPSIHSAGIGQDQRQIPGSLLIRMEGVSGASAGVTREIAPIDARLQIDEIAVTCGEWSSSLNTADPTNDIYIFLACLSSAHPPY